ncbi:MAG TPA: tRNA (adenosine(37)-N6)-dimethylallyltransferase MiaA [Candidatus Limnocylindrales bacterium]
MSAPAAPPLLVIAGPTATGKTALAIAVALALDAGGIPAEVISADSRQVYRGLDIGTAKPTLVERRGVVHHGLDLVEPDQAFSVTDFIAHADGVLSAIAGTGAIAILAGGTGFYLRAIAAGLDAAALPADPGVRRRIEAELTVNGLGATVARLRELAPARAGQVDLRNPRRVARALEIAELAGDAPLPEPRPYPGPIAWLGLDVADRATHASWIARRARAQFDAGLVEEAAALRARFDPSLPAFSAIGYREAWAVLDGETDRESAIERNAARNLAFAKRQRTWFRREPTIEWLDAAGEPLQRSVTVARALAG